MQGTRGVNCCLWIPSEESSQDRRYSLDEAASSSTLYLTHITLTSQSILHPFWISYSSFLKDIYLGAALIILAQIKTFIPIIRISHPKPKVEATPPPPFPPEKQHLVLQPTIPELSRLRVFVRTTRTTYLFRIKIIKIATHPDPHCKVPTQTNKKTNKQT